MPLHPLSLQWLMWKRWLVVLQMPILILSVGYVEGDAFQGKDMSSSPPPGGAQTCCGEPWPPVGATEQ